MLSIYFASFPIIPCLLCVESDTRLRPSLPRTSESGKGLRENTIYQRRIALHNMQLMVVPHRRHNLWWAHCYGVVYSRATNAALTSSVVPQRHNPRNISLSPSPSKIQSILHLHYRGTLLQAPIRSAITYHSVAFPQIRILGKTQILFLPSTPAPSPAHSHLTHFWFNITNSVTKTWQLSLPSLSPPFICSI